MTSSSYANVLYLFLIEKRPTAESEYAWTDDDESSDKKYKKDESGKH